jgi:hypothetical protein
MQFDTPLDMHKRVPPFRFRSCCMALVVGAVHVELLRARAPAPLGGACQLGQVMCADTDTKTDTDTDTDADTDTDTQTQTDTDTDTQTQTQTQNQTREESCCLPSSFSKRQLAWRKACV